MNPPVQADSPDQAVAGVLGTNSAGGPGIVGRSNAGRAISGWSVTNYGVTGDSNTFPGMRGTSVSGRGVEGWSTSGEGVWATSATGTAIVGTTEGPGIGVIGISTSGDAVSGQSASGVGVRGRGGLLAGLFEGAVKITGELYVEGNIRLPQGCDIILEGAADCAEHFDVACGDDVAPGTVLVIGKAGELEESVQPYDRRVAGVVSGAGDFRPGIILDQRQGAPKRQPIALIGKVFCKVDADAAPIEVGDLLTTSSTPGHAMKAQDPSRAFGALLGKALRALPAGQGLIPVLVALQ